MNHHFLRALAGSQKSAAIAVIVYATALVLMLVAIRIPAADPPREYTTEQLSKLESAKKLNAQVVELEKQGKYKEALDPAKKSLELYREVFGERHAAVATASNWVGRLLEKSGDFAAAKPYYEKDLAINRQLLGPKHADTITSLDNLGILLEEMQEYAAAKPYFVKALAANKEVFGSKHYNTILSLYRLGHLCETMGDYVAAKPYFEQALTASRETLGPKHSDTAAALSDLGNLLYLMGDYPAAKSNFEQALAIDQEVHGPKDPHTATSLNNLGALLHTMGDYAAAKPYLEQALTIDQEVLGLKHADTARQLNNLGLLLKTMGDYTAARPYYEQALAIRQEILGPKHPDTAVSLNNLGALLEAMGDYVAAKPFDEQALAIRQEILGPKHPDTALSLNNLGHLLYLMGDYAAAKPNYEQSLAIWTEVLGPKHPLTATSNDNLGLLLQAMGEYAAAMPYLEQALAIKKEVLGSKHPNTAASLDSLGSLCMATGDWARAGSLESDARLAIRDHVASVLPALRERQQLQFVQTQDEGPLWRALSLGLYAAEHPPLASLSAEFLANGKAVIQESVAERAELAMAANDPTLKKSVQELNATRTQLATLLQTTPKPSEAEKHRSELEILDRRERELADKVNAGLGRLDKNRWATLAAVRRGVPANGVLVDIARFQPYNFRAKEREQEYQPAAYVAWLVPPTGSGDVQVIDLGAADTIDTAVSQFQAAFKPCQNPDKEQNPLLKLGEHEAEQQLQTSLAELGKLILDPLKPNLKDKSEIILSPDAALWLVPWAALPVDQTALTPALSQGEWKIGYAIEKWNIRYVTSARDLVNGLRKPSTNPPRIFANPNFNLAVNAVPDALASVFGGKINVTSPTKPDVGMLAMNDLRNRSASTIGPVQLLPGTAQEAASIAPNLKKFTQAEPKTYADNVALEGVFKRLRSPRVLVLSTHGFFLPDQEVKLDGKDRLGLADDNNKSGPLVDKDGNALENPLLRCGLLLAGCNNRDKLPKDSLLDDGVLTGMEIVGTDLRGTELVVLSACETGLGKVNNGEGVAGLRQAFQLAGAQSVVATLWQIPDVQSAQLMNDFFANLAAGQSKSDALRSAQLTRINARREKFGAAHPLFWAAFTLTGGN